MKTKVLVIHTSHPVGHGMKVTAENFFEELTSNNQLEVKLLDITQMEGSGDLSIISKFYGFFLERFSNLWGALYFSKVVMFLTLPLRKVYASFKSKKVLDELRMFQPAIVVSTQNFSSAVIAYLKSKG